jgi:hypothetical protein
MAPGVRVSEGRGVGAQVSSKRSDSAQTFRRLKPLFRRHQRKLADSLALCLPFDEVEGILGIHAEEIHKGTGTELLRQGIEPLFRCDRAFPLTNGSSPGTSFSSTMYKAAPMNKLPAAKQYG